MLGSSRMRDIVPTRSDGVLTQPQHCLCVEPEHFERLKRYAVAGADNLVETQTRDILINDIEVEVAGAVNLRKDRRDG
jgi:hypothetical protein